MGTFRKCYTDIAEKARKAGLIDDEGRPAIVLPGNGGTVLVEASRKPRRKRKRAR